MFGFRRRNLKKSGRNKQFLLLNSPLLSILSKLNRTEWNYMIDILPAESIKLLKNIAYNFYIGNLKFSSNKERQQFKRYKKIIQYFCSSRQHFLRKRDKHLLTSQRGRGLFSLLLPVVTSLIAGLIR